MPNKYINEIIRDLREDNDLNQSEIAKIIGSTQQQYSKYELGISDIPPQCILKLADYFCVSTDYLLGYVDNHRNSSINDKFTLNILHNLNNLSKNDKIELLNYINFIKYKKNLK